MPQALARLKPVGHGGHLGLALTASLYGTFEPLRESPLHAQAAAPPTSETPVSTPVERDGITSYPPEFFSEFRPNTTLDMIQRIPGFSYNSGDGGLRGLARASGNVLIDGQRPSSKSLSLDDIIRRVPLSGVARIELIRGGAPGIDMRGQSVVANIIRKPGAALSGAGELMTKFYDDQMPARVARLEGSRTGGDLSLEGMLYWRQERNQEMAGVGRLIRRDRNRVPTSAGRFNADWDNFGLGGSGAAEYRTGSNFFRLSLSGDRDREDRDDLWSLKDAAGVHFDESVLADFASDQGSIGLDYEREMSSSLTFRLQTLESIEEDRLKAVSTGRNSTQTSHETARSRESVIRAEATYVPIASLTFDGSIERAFNSLDAETRLERDGTPVDLPSADVVVEERRIEAAGSVRWQARPDAAFEAALAYETSTISQEGDVEKSTDLRFLKPRFNATLDPAKNWQIRLRIERVVNQLDFEDFASSSSLDTGTVNAGNPDLIPEQAWLFEGTIEHRFWGRGAVTITASHSFLNDVIDQVPVENRFDAPGNIGSGWRQEMRASLTLPLERLGASGTLVRFNGTWRRSRVTDPVTQEKRRISYQRPFGGDLSITKDLPGLKSIIGADIYFGFEEISYYINEIRTEGATTEPLAKVYWDWTPQPGTVFRFQIENIAFRSRYRNRIFYDGPRSLGLISRYEERTAILEPFIMVRLRKTF